LSAECSVQALSDEILTFQTVCGSLQRRVQMVNDLSEKSRFSGLVHDLVEKLWLGNDLVYVLTEIDSST